MLKQEQRISKTKDFDKIFASNRSFYNDLIGIRFTNTSLLNSRFAILVNLKVSKKAVKRNLIKRQIRSIIELNLDKLAKNKDIVIICLPKIAQADFSTINKALIGGFKKIKLLND